MQVVFDENGFYRVMAPKGGAQTQKKSAPEGWGPEGTSASFFSTSANFDFGQFLDEEFLGPEGWRPKPGKSGVPKPGAPKGEALKGGGPKGVGAQNFALFSLSRHIFHSFLPLLLVLSWNFGGVFEGRGAQMCMFGVLWLSCEAPAAPKAPGLRSTAQPENS